MTPRCHSLLLVLLPIMATAQEPLAPCTGWLATVDEASQQIVLSWHPSSDPAATGYHICTGTPCLDYATVSGRLDTSYTCLDHSPLDNHTYRLHVFDDSQNVSALTPAFGPVVLQADVPECETRVEARWTPYVGMPGHSARYTLRVRLEPFDEDYDSYYLTADTAALRYSFEMPEAVTRAWLKVEVEGEEGQRSLSNVVAVERRTVERASFVEISHLDYDSLNTAVRLGFHLDNSFAADHYTLYRSIDGSPWREVVRFATAQASFSLTDPDINPYDSLHCYQLGVLDACGLNEQYSRTACLVVPTPPPPAVAFPNAIVRGDPDNGRFRPVVRGLRGDLYELSIYNRHGLLVYHTTDPAAGWTPGADTPQGVYAYLLRCRFNTGDIKTYCGTVALIQ